MYPKPTIKDFVNNNGKFLALINKSDGKTSYLTLFIAKDKEKTAEAILNIINDIGECTTQVWNNERADFYIENHGWYYLIDYSNGVIDC